MPRRCSSVSAVLDMTLKLIVEEVNSDDKEFKSHQRATSSTIAYLEIGNGTELSPKPPRPDLEGHERHAARIPVRKLGPKTAPLKPHAARLKGENLSRHWMRLEHPNCLLPPWDQRVRVPDHTIFARSKPPITHSRDAATTLCLEQNNLRTPRTAAR